MWSYNHFSISSCVPCFQGPGPGFRISPILEASNSFVGAWEGLYISKKSFIIVYIPNIYFYQLFVIFTCSSRLCLYMYLSLGVCLCTNASLYMFLLGHKCVVVQLSVSCDHLNVCLWGFQTMRDHSFLNFIFLVIREKDKLYILSLECVGSIQKPINLLKIAYHAVSYLLHH